MPGAALDADHGRGHGRQARQYRRPLEPRGLQLGQSRQRQRRHRRRQATGLRQGGDGLRLHRSQRPAAQDRSAYVAGRQRGQQSPAARQYHAGLAAAEAGRAARGWTAAAAASSARGGDGAHAPDIEPGELRIGAGDRRAQRQRVLRLIAERVEPRN